MELLVQLTTFPLYQQTFSRAPPLGLRGILYCAWVLILWGPRIILYTIMKYLPSSCGPGQMEKFAWQRKEQSEWPSSRADSCQCDLSANHGTGGVINSSPRSTAQPEEPPSREALGSPCSPETVRSYFLPVRARLSEADACWRLPSITAVLRPLII